MHNYVCVQFCKVVGVSTVVGVCTVKGVCTVVGVCAIVEGCECLQSCGCLHIHGLVHSCIAQSILTAAASAWVGWRRRSSCRARREWRPGGLGEEATVQETSLFRIV